MQYSFIMNVNITKIIKNVKRTMSNMVKIASDRIYQTFEYRWENLYGHCRLCGLVNSNLKYWRWE